MLPPWFCWVLKLLALPPGKENGALAAFCCASTARVAVSNNVKPAMNFEPSGEIDNTFETKLTVLARRIVEEDTSYTNTLRVLPLLFTPMISDRSFVASSALRVERAVLPSGGAIGAAAGVGPTSTTEIS